jgi:FMN hydrolase / 5-amino-6-(5-phospho-D-ribitylamino)uracil phosphatase
MKKAQNVKIISIDLFRTIVDIDQTPDMIWQLFLKNNFPVEVAREHHKKAVEIMDRHWETACRDYEHFKTVRKVLEETVTELFTEIKLDRDIQPAAGLLMGDHSLQKVFADARPFLRKAGLKYPICLSTDCDTEMIENVGGIYPFDRIFVSETLQCYKQNPVFFKHVISHYGVKPENILHIGDSKSDIATPKQLGVQTCWLNRRNSKWEHSVKPDFEVKSLLEILDILD